MLNSLKVISLLSLTGGALCSLGTKWADNKELEKKIDERVEKKFKEIQSNKEESK